MAGYFIKESVNNYLKQMKTRQLASKDTYDWYNSLYNYNIGQISQIKGRFPFEPGKIYVFRYKPITKELPFYDKNPIILCLGKRINIDGSVVFAGIDFGGQVVARSKGIFLANTKAQSHFFSG